MQRYDQGDQWLSAQTKFGHQTSQLADHVRAKWKIEQHDLNGQLYIMQETSGRWGTWSGWSRWSSGLWGFEVFVVCERVGKEQGAAGWSPHMLLKADRLRETAARRKVVTQNKASELQTGSTRFIPLKWICQYQNTVPAHAPTSSSRPIRILCGVFAYRVEWYANDVAYHACYDLSAKRFLNIYPNA